MAKQKPVGDTIQRQLETPNGTITYEFTPKRVKNMNIRIHPDGRLTVSAGPGVPFREVERFLYSRSQWISDALARIEARRQDAGPGSLMLWVWVWGEKIPLSIHPVSPGSPEGVSLPSGHIEISLSEDSPAQRQKWAVQLWKQEALRVFPSRFAFWSAHFKEKYHLDTGKIRLSIKPMTTRWGSFSKRTGTIALSLYLSSKPPEFLEYTIVHEFCHMVYLDHSPAFHALVEENLPGASAIRRKMKDNPIQG